MKEQATGERPGPIPTERDEIRHAVPDARAAPSVRLRLLTARRWESARSGAGESDMSAFSRGRPQRATPEGRALLKELERQREPEFARAA